jgi:hypothetical protein
MKSLMFCMLLFGSTIYVYAQSLYTAGVTKPTNSISPLLVQSPMEAEYRVAKPPGLRMRNAGRTLTVLGGAMLIGGIVLVNNADDLYYSSQSTSYGTYEEGDPQGALGVLMIVGGAGMSVPGIILWSKGAKKYNRYLEKQEASQTSLSFKGRTLSLAYRF